MNSRKLSFHTTHKKDEENSYNSLQYITHSNTLSIRPPNYSSMDPKLQNSHLNLTPKTHLVENDPDKTVVSQRYASFHSKEFPNSPAAFITNNLQLKTPNPSHGQINSFLSKTSLVPHTATNDRLNATPKTPINGIYDSKKLELDSKRQARATENNIQSLLHKAKIDSQKTKLHEWIVAYRHAFPTFSFYFDGVPDHLTKNLSIAVRSLSAKVESFFSVNEVTHVIIPEDPSSFSPDKPQPLSNVFAAAQKFGLKIWTVDKLLNRVLKYLLPSHQSASIQQSKVLGKRNLSEVIQKEKLSSRGTLSVNGISNMDFYYFKHTYALVEDSDHLHRPILMNDYCPPESGDEPPWPKLYYVPKGRCPFVRYDDSTSSKDSDSDSNSDSCKEELSLKDEECEDSEAQPTSDGSESATSATSDEQRKDELQHQHGIADLMENNELIWPKNAQLLKTVGSTHLIDSIASGAVALNSITSTSTINRPYHLDKSLQNPNLNNHAQTRIDQLSRLEQAIRPVTDRGNHNLLNPEGARNQLSNNANYAKNINKTSLSPANPQPQNNSDRKIKPYPRLHLPLIQTKKPTAQPRQTIVSRPGYCENCKLKYEDMIKHVESSSHQAFANDKSNWVDLDHLLDNVKRPLAKNTSSFPSPNTCIISKNMCKSDTQIPINRSLSYCTNQFTPIHDRSGARATSDTNCCVNSQSAIEPTGVHHFRRPLSHPVSNNRLNYNHNGTHNNPIVIMETSSNSIADAEQSAQMGCAPQILNYTPHASYYSNSMVSHPGEYQYQNSMRSSSQRIVSNLQLAKVQPTPSESQNFTTITSAVPDSANSNSTSHTVFSNSRAFSLQPSNFISGNQDVYSHNSPQIGTCVGENTSDPKNSIMLTPALQSMQTSQGATTLVNQRFESNDMNAYSNLSNADFITPTKNHGYSRNQNQHCDNLLYNTNNTALGGYQNEAANVTDKSETTSWLKEQGVFVTYSNPSPQDYCSTYHAGINTIPPTAPMLELEGDRSTSY